MKKRVLVFMVILLNSCSDESTKKYLFEGEIEFENLEKKFEINRQQARSLVKEHVSNDDSIFYSYHPYEVIVIIDNGYLFVNGDHKNMIRLKGWFVTPKTQKIERRNYNIPVSLKEYFNKTQSLKRFKSSDQIEE